jgi:pimeloyl-ACP methyl ester carboxylesterase
VDGVSYMIARRPSREPCSVPWLAGEDDPVSPAAGASLLAASLTNATVQVELFARVGHGVFSQEPLPAFDLLHRFLGDVVPADQPLTAGPA